MASGAKLVREMDTQEHWEHVYGTKAPTEVSWFRPHLETSLSLVERVAGDRSASIIDVGGGESTFVDDLIAKGYRNVTVLDISGTAIKHTKKRLDASIAAGYLAHRRHHQRRLADVFLRRLA